MKLLFFTLFSLSLTIHTLLNSVVLPKVVSKDLYGFLKVYGNNESGEILVNNTNHLHQYSLNVTNHRDWSLNVHDNPYCNPCMGFLIPHIWKSMHVYAGVMMYIDPDGYIHGCAGSCSIGEVWLRPGESIRLKMADCPNCYNDNGGFAIVEWSILK